MKRLIATTTAVMMSGCSLLTPPKARPIVEDHSSSPWNWRGGVKYGVYTTSAERREVLIKYFKLEDGQWHSTMCAEPSPDVAEAITSSLTGSLTASAQASDAEKANATLAATQALATSINSLFKRSQGVQFFRDGAFALCTAYLNGWMTDAQYSEAYKSLLTASTGLIALEMPNQKQHTPPLLPRSWMVAYGLTPCEAEVCDGILRGASAGDIAKLRGVQEITVRCQVRAILDKVGVTSMRALCLKLSLLPR